MPVQVQAVQSRRHLRRGQMAARAGVDLRDCGGYGPEPLGVARRLQIADQHRSARRGPKARDGLLQQQTFSRCPARSSG